MFFAQQTEPYLSDPAGEADDASKKTSGRAPEVAWLGMPSGAWARVVLLFSSLAALKLALLVRLSGQLFDIHWRVSTTEPIWSDYAAFSAFVIIGTVGLWELGRQCSNISLRAVRCANGIVLALGLLFISLTFHNGNKNYLYPIISGVLKWTSLGPYLSLDLFFRPPFLAGWLLVYGFVYYVLARLGKESGILRVTAIFAAAYASLWLRELVGCRNELWAANCLGMTSLFVLRRAPSNWSLAWLLVPVAWALFFAGELLLHAPAHGGFPLLNFRILLGGSVLIFTLAALLARRNGFFRPWSCLLFFYFVSFLLLANSHYPVAPNYTRALCLGLEFPHYLFGEFAIAALVAATGLLYFRGGRARTLWWMDALSVALIALSFIDLRLLQIMGVRLEWNVLSLGNSPKMMWRMAAPYVPGALAGFAGLALAYSLALCAIRSWLRRLSAPASQTPASSSGRWYAVACFLLLGFLGLLLATADKAMGQSALRLAQTSPFWKRLINRPLNPEDFLRASKELGLGDFKAGTAVNSTRQAADLNLLLVFMESSYNKYLSLFGAAEETQPLLSKYKERMELFPNFFSTFASSIHARFASFTGLYPVRDFNAFTLERVNVKSLFEVLHDRDYACSMFYSSFAEFTGFADFLKQRGLDAVYDAHTMPGQRTTEPVSWGLREEETLGAIREQIKRYSAVQKRFFLTYVPAAPHYPYEKVPEAFRKFKMSSPDDFTPLYLNELLYMDWVLASILDQLKESGLLDKTLVVITDDHGEMLGANKGPIGHGWLLTPQLANAPLIILDPRNPGFHLNYAIGSQVDLLPTLLDKLRIAIPPDQLYQGRSLYGPPPPADLRIYLNSYQQYGIIAGNYFLRGDREMEPSAAAGYPPRAFLISNQGAKTLFDEAQAPGQRPISIAPFDQFQESLLRNYSFYCASLRGPQALP